MMGMLLTGGTLNSIFEFITVLVIFIFILVLCYFTTRWIGGYEKSKSVRQNLELKEVIRLGNNKSIGIVRAGVDKYLVVAFGKDEINLLATLTGDDIIEYQGNAMSTSASSVYGEAFKDLLDRFKKNGDTKKEEDSETEDRT